LIAPTRRRPKPTTNRNDKHEWLNDSRAAAVGFPFDDSSSPAGRLGLPPFSFARSLGVVPRMIPITKDRPMRRTHLLACFSVAKERERPSAIRLRCSLASCLGQPLSKRPSDRVAEG